MSIPAFGQQLYEGLRRHPDGLKVLTSRLNYSGIQEFKQADRPHAAYLLRALGYETVQRLKSDDPRSLPLLLLNRHRQLEREATRGVYMLMAMSYLWWHLL